MPYKSLIFLVAQFLMVLAGLRLVPTRWILMLAAPPRSAGVPRIRHPGARLLVHNILLGHYHYHLDSLRRSALRVRRQGHLFGRVPDRRLACEMAAGFLGLHGQSLALVVVAMDPGT